MLLTRLAALSLLLAVCFAQVPKQPTWPDQFTTKFVVRVEQYGPDWSADGVIYYDWTAKTFRTDFIDWCLPLFDSGPTDKNNFTCTFLATEGNMYFVNHTANLWKDYQCCMFEKGLAPVPPDWVKNCKYNGTATIRGIECDVWWFAGTSDPNEPCYGYWDSIEPDTLNKPVQFFGLSSIGPTILEYMTFEHGPIPKNIDIGLPNLLSCSQDCEPPPFTKMKKADSSSRKLKYPHFPSCE